MKKAIRSLLRKLVPFDEVAEAQAAPVPAHAISSAPATQAAHAGLRRSGSAEAPVHTQPPVTAAAPPPPAAPPAPAAQPPPPPQAVPAPPQAPASASAAPPQPQPQRASQQAQAQPQPQPQQVGLGGLGTAEPRRLM